MKLASDPNSVLSEVRRWGDAFQLKDMLGPVVAREVDEKKEGKARQEQLNKKKNNGGVNVDRLHQWCLVKCNLKRTAPTN